MDRDTYLLAPEECREYMKDAFELIEMGKATPALMCCRNALEALVNRYCSHMQIDVRETDLNVKIDMLHESGIVDSKANELLHKTRIMCNKAAHADRSVTMDEAVQAFAYLEELLKGSLSDLDYKMDLLRDRFNEPMVDPDYYSESRRYRGKWANCYDRASLMMIPEYVELLDRAEKDNDVEAMLDIAIGFLPRNITWNNNMLINTAPVMHRGKEYSQENSYDARYYYWAARAVLSATTAYGKGEYYPKKYLATAIWDTALIGVYLSTNPQYYCRLKGFEETYDRSGGHTEDQPVYEDQYIEVARMFGLEDTNSVLNMLSYACVSPIVQDLIEEFFFGKYDCSIVAPVHTDGRKNALFKIRFMKYVQLAAENVNATGVNVLNRIDAQDINKGYAMLEGLSPGCTAGLGAAAEGEPFRWEMLKPYTIGSFCDRIYRYAYNSSKKKDIFSKPKKSGSFIMDFLFGM